MTRLSSWLQSRKRWRWVAGHRKWPCFADVKTSRKWRKSTGQQSWKPKGGSRSESMIAGSLIGSSKHVIEFQREEGRELRNSPNDEWQKMFSDATDMSHSVAPYRLNIEQFSKFFWGGCCTLYESGGHKTANGRAQGRGRPALYITALTVHV